MLSLRIRACDDPEDGPTTIIARSIAAGLARLYTTLGRRARFDSGTVVATVPLPEVALLAASRAQPRPWAIYFNARLRSSVTVVPGEAQVALSASADIISFGVPFENRQRRGIIAVRPMNRWPLALPNVARNVAVHDLRAPARPPTQQRFAHAHVRAPSAVPSSRVRL